MQQIRSFIAATWTSYRQQSRRTQAIIASIGGVVLLACCAIGNAANSTGNNNTGKSTATHQSSAATAHPMPTATMAPLSEHLTFSGDIVGVITTGLNPQPLTHSNPIPDPVQQNNTFFAPPPTATQCADFASLPGSTTPDDYLGIIIGKVGSKQYAVEIEINEDQQAYTNPGTPLTLGDNGFGGSITIDEFSGQQRTWLQVYGPSLQEPVIILNKDRRSGTVDAWMETGQAQIGATPTLHLKGNWRCG